MATKFVRVSLWLFVVIGSVVSWTLPDLEEDLEEELKEDLFNVFWRQHPIGLPCKDQEFICRTYANAVCCDGYCHYNCHKEEKPQRPVKPITTVPGDEAVLPSKPECQTLITWSVCRWDCREADDLCQVCKQKYGSELDWEASP